MQFKSRILVIIFIAPFLLSVVGCGNNKNCLQYEGNGENYGNGWVYTRKCVKGRDVSKERIKICLK